MSNEARVLKEMRLAKGYSMRKAGELIGLSDSYIAHIETGRMDPPRGDKLDRILSIYGPIKQKSFYEKVRNYRHKMTKLDELNELISRANPTQVEALLSIAKGLISRS